MKIKLLRPVEPRFRISSPFGPRKIFSGFHNGIDFAVPIGSEVRAMINGDVHRVGFENPDDKTQGFGLRIMQTAVIDSVRYFIWYGHLSEILVREKDTLRAGDLIAKSGNTGRSTGPHLHVGTRKADTPDWFDMEFA